MSSIGTTRPTAVAAPDDAIVSRSYVEWAPIFAGAVVAAVIALAMTTFGSAIGLAMTSPYPWSGASGTAVAIVAAIWALWVAASAAMAGGYLAGRLRHRSFDSTQHESEIRNGAHGLTTWAVAALIVGFAGILAAGSANRGTWMTPGEADTPKLVERAADSLLRSDRVPNDMLKRQVVPLLEKSATGHELSADERTFMSRVTAAQTGLTATDADARVAATVTGLRNDVNTARKFGVLVAFLAAATLAICAAVAWWGATLGGQHRDEGTRVALLNIY